MTQWLLWLGRSNFMRCIQDFTWGIGAAMQLACAVSPLQQNHFVFFIYHSQRHLLLQPKMKHKTFFLGRLNNIFSLSPALLKNSYLLLFAEVLAKINFSVSIVLIVFFCYVKQSYMHIALLNNTISHLLIDAF